MWIFGLDALRINVLECESQETTIFKANENIAGFN